jgi:pilus assembly protein Flp/PilA
VFTQNRLMARVDHQVNIARETSMRKLLFSRFVKDQSGVTAIEYGLIAAGIAIAIITAVNGVGSSLSTVFGNISTSLK